MSRNRGVFSIQVGDITQFDVDAIVNAANKSLCGGGGVDGAIHRAAGPKLLEECKTLGGCEVGEAKITRGYDLKARHVIHTVGPVWDGGDKGEAALLESCYKSCLGIAGSMGLRSIAFPAISCGAYRFPIRSAAEIIIRVLKSELESSSLQEILLVLFDSKIEKEFVSVLKKSGA